MPLPKYAAAQKQAASTLHNFAKKIPISWTAPQSAANAEAKILLRAVASEGDSMYAYEYEIYERVELTAISQTTLYWDIPGDVDRGQPGQQFVIVAVPAGDDDHPEHLEVETLPFTMDESRSSGFSGTSVFVTTPHSAFELPPQFPAETLLAKSRLSLRLRFPYMRLMAFKLALMLSTLMRNPFCAIARQWRPSMRLHRPRT